MHHARRDTDLNPPAITVSLSAPTDTARGSRLYGRRTECQALDRLIADVRESHSRVLIIRGEAGAGKTALLEYLAERSSGSGCRVARMVGVQSEMGLAFAGLHQLYAPMLSRAERLPVLQRNALQYASGLAAGPSPDGFLVGVAVLSLLAVVARERPLICVIDDEQLAGPGLGADAGVCGAPPGGRPGGAGLRWFSIVTGVAWERV